MSMESPILPTFRRIEIELNWSIVRVPTRFHSVPPGSQTLIYHLMDLFISYPTPYNHARPIESSFQEIFSIIICKINYDGQQTFIAAAIIMKKSVSK